MKTLKKHRCFDGETLFCEHSSALTQTKMKFSCFLPVVGEKPKKAIIWLSGLTCNEENFITKAGAQKILSGGDTMIICPDTSPRGLELEGEHDFYDFGSGASFYVNATTEGYKDHYKMYDYIVQELTEEAVKSFGVEDFRISGHSMGGHGALVMGLREKNLFKKVSALAPLAHPTKSAWGQKAFRGYLGEDESAWEDYDATRLISKGYSRTDSILIDQGLKDQFYKEGQLRTEDFEKACKERGQEIKVNYHDDFDHSYYFVATFIENHLRHLTS